MYRHLLSAALVAAPFAPALADGAHDHKTTKAYEHAPIGVMGDHLHKKGEVMVSFRYMRMEMEGQRIGDNGVSLAEAQQGDGFQYVVIPEAMPMDMYMVGAMYAPTDRLTLMAMGSYVSNTMDHVRDPADTLPPIPTDTFTTSSDGFGDLKLSALFGIFDGENRSAHLNFGVSIPTGTIDNTDVTPAAPNGTTLPFGMQIGSGTWDFTPGATFLGYNGPVGYGAQVKATLRTGENDENYRLGDEAQFTAWGSYAFADWVSASARVKAMTWGQVDGEGPDRSGIPTAGNPMLDLVPTIRTQNYGGERIDLGFGVNLAAQNAGAKGHRLGVEVLFPVYQDLNGPQLETDWVLTIGWQKTL